MAKIGFRYEISDEGVHLTLESKAMLKSSKRLPVDDWLGSIRGPAFNAISVIFGWAYDEDVILSYDDVLLPHHRIA